MTDSTNPKAVAFSVRVYERLLAVYPAEFRREFGPSMKQVFRDQCMDATAAEGKRGLFLLWCRALLDWIKTVALEHGADLFRSASPLATVAKIYVLVFAFALLCGGAAAYLAPKKLYFSKVTIEVIQKSGDFTVNRYPRGMDFWSVEPRFLDSEETLDIVRAKLRLNQQSPNGVRGTYHQLNELISVSVDPSRNLMFMTVTNSNSEMAAQIANAIVDAYKNRRREMADKDKKRCAFIRQELVDAGFGPRAFSGLRTPQEVVPSIVNPAKVDPYSFVLIRSSAFRTWFLWSALVALVAVSLAKFTSQDRLAR
jgi:capsular polysaccharide biosynthesis protein